MMFKLNLTQEEMELMKRVCELQLDSLGRILNGNHTINLKEKLSQHRVSQEELMEMISNVSKQYRDLLDQPEHLFDLHADLLCNFRDALDYNTNQLSDFSRLISPMLNKLDLAIFILQHRN